MDDDFKKATTTTKITIDLSPSPPQLESNMFKFAKYQRSHSHSFKSTSLILNTIRNNDCSGSTNGVELSNRKTVPADLEKLKKMYEDVHSDSDADKEVQLLMSGEWEKDNLDEDERSSVVSGSWSKMKAYKAINQHMVKSCNATTTKCSKLIAQIEEENKVSKEELSNRLRSDNVKQMPSRDETTRNYGSHTYSNISKSKYSPIVTRKVPSKSSRQDLKSPLTTEKLSSPSLVCSSNNLDLKKHEQPERLPKCKQETYPVPKTASPKITSSGRKSPAKETKASNDSKTESRLAFDGIILRQPKDSEMTYFGVNISPKAANKVSKANIRKGNQLAEKPDILQHYTSKSKEKLAKKSTKNVSSISQKKSSRHSSPAKHESPVYENVQSTRYKKKEFDSSILDELTKAADEILKVVNGYADDDLHNRFSTDEDEKRASKPQLATISETATWKQNKIKESKVTSTSKAQVRPKLKSASPASSLESIKDARKLVSSSRKKEQENASVESVSKRKMRIESGGVKANTKARRLQRATSREALLQSHGSSSEDLTVNVEMPMRKPRLVKKTKSSQLTITNGFEVKKRSSDGIESQIKDEKSKQDERMPGSLPEIRHKTAISTIKSTAERTSRERSRERGLSKTKHEDSRKRVLPKSEANRGVVSTTKTDRSKAVPSKETVSHRTAVAYVPIPTYRSGTKHGVLREISADECPCLCS